MLPSTGYFKAIACPFYEGGSCDRPYCHFKHARREEAPTVLAASTASEITEKVGKTQAAGCNTTGDATNTLSQLVSEAVKKVLAEQQVIDKEEISLNIVSKVVEQLKPTLAGSLQSSSVPVEPPPKPVVSSSPCTYNPTPISELKKRHISIPIYNPARESKVTVKRKGSPDERTRSWHSILLKNDDSDESTYKPTPVSSNTDPVPGYVPTAKSSTVSTPVTYDPSAIETYASKSKELYYPKPKKRREEYVPKKVKTNLNNESLDPFEMDVSNQDSCSQDFMDIEPRFSDDEEEEKAKEETEQSKQKLATQEKENRDLKQTDKRDGKSSSSSKKSSKTEDQVNGSKHKNEEGKESRKKDEKKHSKHEDKTKSSSRSSSSSKHSSSKDKKKDSKDKDRKDRDKEKDKKNSSRHDSHKSKKTSRSDKEDKHKKSSSSPKDDKKKSSSTSKHSEKSSKSSSRDKSSKKSSSSSSKKENEIDEKLLLSEKELFDFDDSDVDIEEECYKIFQEYEESDQPKPSKVSEYQPKLDEKTDEEVGKKRVAHASAESSIVRKPGPSQPIKRQPNPQQKLYERWRLMREAAAEKAKAAASTENKSVVPDKISAPSPKSLFPKSSLFSKDNHTFNGNGKIRIAHVPLAMSLALSKKPVVEKPKEPEQKTPAQTSKDKPRVAHVPVVVPQLIRPEPLETSTQKFTLNVRQFYLNLMHDVCIQIYTSGEDAAQRALSEELSCHERCRALNVYKNSCMLAIHRLKKELEQDKSGDISVAPVSKLVSHEAILAGKSKGSWSVMKPKRIVADFKGPLFYRKLAKWILTEQQLKDNGYPRPHPDGQNGHAKVYVIDSRSNSKLSKIPNERMCVRCGESYMVNKKGFAVNKEQCTYHWGRKFTVRGEGRYSCCQQIGAVSGCSDAATHVWDYVDYENLRGYVKTLPKDNKYIPDEDQGVFSLDCEMSYTTQGLELTRVTVINEHCQVIYNTLVKPENPIIDYNTRFSGITEEAMKGVTTTIFDVQATLLTMFTAKTILVGHSLESDFKALKLIHDTVVDTSVMFPHRSGPPHKRALRNLCSEYLRKLIQNNVGGHDSNEDAVACMELVQWKVREEAKLQ